MSTPTPVIAAHLGDRGWYQNPQLHSYWSRVILHAVQITMWDPSLTTQTQLADSIKPQALGLKSTTLTTGPHG